MAGWFEVAAFGQEPTIATDCIRAGRESRSMRMAHTRELVIRCLSALIASSYASAGRAADVPVSVEKTAQCMVAVLEATPDVVAPVLGTTSSDGWTHPFLEYRADEALTRTRAIRFDARQPSSGNGYRGYWFMAWMSGFGAPEYHVTKAVMHKWEARCHADVVLFFP